MVMERDDGNGRAEGGCWLSCPAGAGAGAHSNKMEITAASEPLSAVCVCHLISIVHAP